MSATPAIGIVSSGQIIYGHMQPMSQQGLPPERWMVGPSAGAESLVGAQLRQVGIHETRAMRLGKGGVEHRRDR